MCGLWMRPSVDTDPQDFLEDMDRQWIRSRQNLQTRTDADLVS